MKYQTIEHRVADVLLIIQLMNLDMYLEMRMMAVWVQVWSARVGTESGIYGV